MKKASKIIKDDKELISPSYTRSYPLVIDHGSGSHVWDVDGKIYLDFSSGIAVANVGHRNLLVTRAVKNQAEKITHNAGTDFYNELLVKLARELSNITPERFKKRVFFTNSGTEAIECAFKLARWYTKRTRMISFLGAFHGRTFASMTLSASKLVHRDHFSPLVPGVVQSPYAYCYRCPFDHEEERCDFECLQYLENQILGKIVPPDEVAAVFVEPIQGENGYIIPPKQWHKKLGKICRENDFLLIVDEIQTGFARSGKFFASEHFNIKPDVICLAKAMAGGLPLGACLARKNIMSWPKGSHATTFGGNPIACAASLATIEYIKKNKLWKNAARLGKFGLKFLEDLQKDFHSKRFVIGDVRGLGLMLGIELVKNRKTKEPAERELKSILMNAFKKGLILLSGGESTIRIAPPLTIQQDDFEHGLDILEKALKESG